MEQLDNKGPQQRENPAERLVAVLPRWLVITITVILTILLIAFLIAGSFWPRVFQHYTAKFFVCTMLAFCFSIFMFVLYPQKIRIHNIPLINLPVEVVGPPALFFCTLPMLWHLYPDPSGRFYRLPIQSPRLHVQTIELKVLEGHACTCQTVTDPNSNDSEILTGIYVEFKGTENKCRVEIGDPYKTFTAVFERDAKKDFIELRSL